MALALDKYHRPIHISTLASRGDSRTTARTEGRRQAALAPVQVRRIREYIQTNLAADLGVAELAGQVNLSPHHFSMLFKHALGAPPHQYVLQERIDEARRQLAAGRMEISELALQLGFSDQSHFCRAFRKITGMTPKQYRSTH
jgi:AraC family transcriptional regulator